MRDWRQGEGNAPSRRVGGWGGKEISMAKRGQRIVVKLRSTESGHIYITEKSRRNTQGRLELRKFDPYLRKHVLYRETK